MNRKAGEAKAPEWRSLLVVKPTSLGDVVQSLCVPCSLKRAFPDRRIGFLVSESYVSLLEGHPCIDEVIPFPYRRMKSGVSGMFAAFREIRRRLRRGGWDAALDLQGLARSGLAMWLSGAAVRAGFSDAREMSGLVCTERIISDRKREHAVVRYMKAAAFFGGDVSRVEFGLSPDEAAVGRFKEAAGGSSPVGLVPGARWETKRWPLERFAELGGMLRARTGRALMLLGSPAESALCAALEKKLGGGVLNLCGKTGLKDLAAALASCVLVVSNDSGPMHLAAALGVKTVSLFGPTSPARIAPWGQESLVVKTSLSCSPCYRRKCRTMPPPCLEEITPARVFETCVKALDGNG